MSELCELDLRLVPGGVGKPRPFAARSFQASSFLKRLGFLRQSLCSSEPFGASRSGQGGLGLGEDVPRA